MPFRLPITPNEFIPERILKWIKDFNSSIQSALDEAADGEHLTDVYAFSNLANQHIAGFANYGNYQHEFTRARRFIRMCLQVFEYDPPGIGPAPGAAPLVFTLEKYNPATVTTTPVFTSTVLNTQSTNYTYRVIDTPVGGVGDPVFYPGDMFNLKIQNTGVAMNWYNVVVWLDYVQKGFVR